MGATFHPVFYFIIYFPTGKTTFFKKITRRVVICEKTTEVQLSQFYYA